MYIGKGEQRKYMAECINHVTNAIPGIRFIDSNLRQKGYVKHLIDLHFRLKPDMGIHLLLVIDKRFGCSQQQLTSITFEVTQGGSKRSYVKQCDEEHAYFQEELKNFLTSFYPNWDIKLADIPHNFTDIN